MKNQWISRLIYAVLKYDFAFSIADSILTHTHKKLYGGSKEVEIKINQYNDPIVLAYEGFRIFIDRHSYHDRDVFTIT